MDLPEKMTGMVPKRDWGRRKYFHSGKKREKRDGFWQKSGSILKGVVS
jgi:hypothetical protein